MSEPGFKIGDHVECAHDRVWQEARQDRDKAKARKEGRSFFTGNAAAYMHLDEAYVITRITPNGGLRLRGFAATVSPRDVRLSTQPVYR